MKRICLLTALTASLAAITPCEASNFNETALIAQCNLLPSQQTHLRDYVTGVVDGAFALSNRDNTAFVCSGATEAAPISIDDQIALVCKLAKDPRVAGKPAGAIVAAALVGAFPCGQGT